MRRGPRSTRLAIAATWNRSNLRCASNSARWTAVSRSLRRKSALVETACSRRGSFLRSKECDRGNCPNGLQALRFKPPTPIAATSSSSPFAPSGKRSSKGAFGKARTRSRPSASRTCTRRKRCCRAGASRSIARMKRQLPQRLLSLTTCKPANRRHCGTSRTGSASGGCCTACGPGCGPSSRICQICTRISRRKRCPSPDPPQMRRLPWSRRKFSRIPGRCRRSYHEFEATRNTNP
mmetsp:Transcript_14460/g.43020  ORF Transcript_14460/g.43020 Transcript_14460/m.43020 type:complete len:236 (+) Transcript_14460:65-772(+)